MKQKSKDPVFIEAETFEPLIKWAAEEKGRKPLIAAAMSEATNKLVRRQLIDRWLNPNPARRESPRYGVAIVLLDVGKKLMKQS